jgi:hypothetical protein
MKLVIILRKLFSFISLLTLIASIFLFFYVGFGISQSRNTSGLPGFEGIVYVIPFGLIFLSLIFLVLTFIFHLLTKKNTKWHFKKFLGRWLVLLLISLISFALLFLIIGKAHGFVDYKGLVNEILENLEKGIRSGFSYCGASNLEELWQNAEFIKISEKGFKEGLSHDINYLG